MVIPCRLFDYEVIKDGKSILEAVTRPPICACLIYRKWNSFSQLIYPFSWSVFASPQSTISKKWSTRFFVFKIVIGWPNKRHNFSITWSITNYTGMINRLDPSSSAKGKKGEKDFLISVFSYLFLLMKQSFGNIDQVGLPGCIFWGIIIIGYDGRGILCP